MTKPKEKKKMPTALSDKEVHVLAAIDNLTAAYSAAGQFTLPLICSQVAADGYPGESGANTVSNTLTKLIDKGYLHVKKVVPQPQ